MKLIILNLALVVFCVKCYSQNLFDKGYLISNGNQRVECLINNLDWLNNPTDFEYRLSKDAPIQRAIIDSVKEFGIYGRAKFIRAFISIDRSNDEIDNLSAERNPSFTKELLYLKYIVDGSASLFQYVDGNLMRYFFKMADTEIEQLVYKRYVINYDILQNNHFRQQLIGLLKCEAIRKGEIEKLKYRYSDLGKLFDKYNRCLDTSYHNNSVDRRKLTYNLNIRPGLNIANLTIENTAYNGWNFNIDPTFSFRVGLESELVLPFNNSKWGVILEPTYQKYKASKVIYVENYVDEIRCKVTYQSLELPVGIRHYFLRNNKYAVFGNITYVFDFSLSSSAEFVRSGGSVPVKSLDIKPGRNVALGVGISKSNKFSLELRYSTPKDILNNYAFWNSSFQTFSIIAGYTLY